MISRWTSMCLLAASGIASAFVPPQAFTQVARPEQQALSSSSHVAISGTPLGLNAMHERGSACRSPSPLFLPQARLFRSVLCERKELLTWYVAVQDALFPSINFSKSFLMFFCVVPKPTAIFILCVIHLERLTCPNPEAAMYGTRTAVGDSEFLPPLCPSKRLMLL